MGKLAQLATVKSAKTETFVYVPSDAAYKAARILLRANLGLTPGAPPSTTLEVLTAVLRGLRRASPLGRILIIDRICPSSSAERVFERLGLAERLDEEMRFAASDELVQKAYGPLQAPAYLEEFDCVVSLTGWGVENGQVRSALEGLYGLARCDDAYLVGEGETRHRLVCDYLAPHIDDWIVELPRAPQREGQVVWGKDGLAVEETACRLAGVPVPPHVLALRANRS
ncbi:MAG: hypothetical protein NZ750_00180 [Anaerolineae bacterium]|nr:hypothetical protein [Anaerolineae bacterium]MDW8171960.1 hypothetical protein [Anaerolineae bacterium]